LPATVLLPREEVIVRVVKLPGVADKDAAAAIELQIDTLHPWGDEDVAWAWARTGRHGILVGLVRKALLDSYETLLSEAGIKVAAVTFSSAVIYAALRMRGAAPASLLCFFETAAKTEVYGESEARAVYSAEFTLAPARALALSRSELRLEPEYPARTLSDSLPAPSAVTGEYSPVAYAAALAASTPFVSRFANLIPTERRASNVRRQFILPAALGILLITGLIVGFVVLPAIEQRKYLDGLNAEIRRLQPAATRAQTLEKLIDANRTKVAALDDFRRRPQADLDILGELTRILPAQVWTTSIEIYPDSVVISGEADQAAPLLKLLDSSPLFQNSDFALSPSHNAQSEQFRIKTLRRNRVGRTTP
jgi:Tfp pilus assembly protein PilN